MTPKPMGLRATWASMVHDLPGHESRTSFLVRDGDGHNSCIRVRFNAKQESTRIRTEIKAIQGKQDREQMFQRVQKVKFQDFGID